LRGPRVAQEATKRRRVPTGPKFGPVIFLAVEETELQRGEIGRGDLSRATQHVTMAWHAVPVVGDRAEPNALCGFKWTERPSQAWDPSALERCPDCSKAIAELKPKD
jgi:hypothetical protein